MLYRRELVDLEKDVEDAKILVECTGKSLMPPQYIPKNKGVEMKKYLKFKKEKYGHSVWNNKGDYLGSIEKNRKKWKFYFDEPSRGDVVWFTSDCLRQLADFLDKLVKEQK
jgi:hypothetical protein